ncbi:uncharacterized protein At1g04910-like [Carica papaya]|uniref:uncharacterized protein At1g04910-like n=1 Tax=Carica papaya TaxID=3649 RepID=UPI000B8CECA6|nr:uncharacterized protein At1g04910-like [Carica papaya]
MLKCPSWRCLKGLWGFLGLIGYYCPLVAGYKPICSISYQAIAQRCISCDPEAEEAFKYLKQAMVSILILSLPDFCKPFILETDAFGSEVATVLTQGKGLVAYFSQTLSDSAQRKSMRTVKNIPKYAPAQFYIDNVLHRIKEKKIMALKPFVDRLGYDNVPPEINRLRCRVNYHALKFLPEIEQMADLLVSRMRNRTGSSNPYMALHLRFEKGMVGLSFCDFVGTREEKARMAEYRKKEWPRRYKNGSHLWQLALQKRKEGRCPLEPGEVAVILRAMGYPKETQIYVASGQVYGGQNRMAPLRNMFPNLVTKEELASKDELAAFRKHVTSLAALDFLVCLKSDVFVMTHGGNFAKLIIGARRYMGHRQKSIKPDKGLMSKSFGDPYMGWATFVEDVVVTHQTRTGLPEETFPNYDLWENPLTPCMCKA